VGGKIIGFIIVFILGIAVGIGGTFFFLGNYHNDLIQRLAEFEVRLSGHNYLEQQAAGTIKQLLRQISKTEERADQLAKRLQQIIGGVETGSGDLKEIIGTNSQISGRLQDINGILSKY
jgi:hypothetical protein